MHPGGWVIILDVTRSSVGKFIYSGKYIGDLPNAKCKCRYETYLIPGETLIPWGRVEGGGEGEGFHLGIGYASYLMKSVVVDMQDT